ncbi:MAG: glycosyltransferase [Candidatus Omnitrophota bacterium]
MVPEISVVILCYGAGQRIYGFVAKTIKLLDRFVPSWEIVLVGNYFEGRGDTTPGIVKEIASKRDNIKVVAMVKQGMMGWDARSGLERASGRYICLIDGDEQMPYRDIVRVYRKIKSDGLDLVKTYRALRYDGFARIAVSLIYNTLFSVLFPGIKAWDMNSKPKILKREAYDRMELVSDDWFLDAEIMIQARRLRLKMGQVPSKFYKCNYRNSFVKGNTLFEFLKNLFFARIREFFK